MTEKQKGKKTKADRMAKRQKDRKGKRKTVDNFFEFGVECRNKVELQKFPDNFIKIFLFSNLSSKLVMLCV